MRHSTAEVHATLFPATTPSGTSPAKTLDELKQGIRQRLQYLMLAVDTPVLMRRLARDEDGGLSARCALVARPRHPAEPDPLLLQPHGLLAQAQIAQVVVKRGFLFRQARQIACGGLWLDGPLRPVREQGGAIHQK